MRRATAQLGLFLGKKSYSVIRAVVFDLGGTLLQFNPGRLPWLEWERRGLSGVHRYLEARGYALDWEAFVVHFVESLPERWQRAAEGQGNLRLGEVLREACLACGVSPASGEIQEAIGEYIAPLDANVAVYADAVETLDALRTRGLGIGLISNTMWPGEYHRREMARHELLPYFQHTLFSSDVGIWKPQPGIYHLALEALQVRAEEAIFVGDLPEYDIVGAQRAGMRAVHKRNEPASTDGIRPDATITHLAELAALIDRWSKTESDH